MNFLTVAGILIFTSSLLSIIIVFIKAKKNPTSITWILFNLTVALWGLGLFKAFHTHIHSTALFWGRFLNLTAIWIPIFFFNFTICFAQKIRIKIRELLLYYIATVIYFFFSLLYPNNYIKDVKHISNFNYYPSAGLLYYLFPILFLYFMIYGILNLIWDYKHADTLRQNQIKYLLLGISLGFIGGSTTFFFVFNIEIPPYGIFLVPVYVLIITYAIFKHNLLDINIVIRKTLIYSFIVGALFTLSVTTLYILSQIYQEFLPQKSFLPTIYVILLLSIIFQPLYRWISSFVDKLFFKGTLSQVAEDLQRSEKLATLGVLASGLAHDIKNPLVPIKTYIQNLPDNMNDPEYIRKITKIIPKEVDKITDLINQLRDFAKPSALNLSKVNIHNLLDKKLNLLEHEFGARNIKIEKKYSPALPEINADPVQLERVFLNLFLNAIDAMPKGGSLIVSTETDPSGNVLIKVSDTGIGIEKEDLPHIFDPFFSKGKKKGTGLGLAVADQIIKEHGGRIQVDSYPNGGNVFQIYLCR